MNEKKIQKFLRIKYIREMERFINRVVNYLNTNENLEKSRFLDFVEEKFQKVKECQKVYLSKGYAKELEKFVFKISSLTQKQEMEELKNDILYQANRLRKSKRLRSYQKEKYKKFDEEFWINVIIFPKKEKKCPL